MTTTKKQHYVPQFLLRRFGTGKKRREKIWVLDKSTGKVFQSSIKDIGHENYFYEHEELSNNIDIEQLLGKTESYVAPLLSRINKSGKLFRDKPELVGLSYFVAVQLARSPVVRVGMENFRRIMIDKWGADIKVHPNDPKTIGEYGVEDAKLSSLKFMKNVPKFAKILQEKVWSLCKAPSQSAYIISDNPITRHNMFERAGRGNLGIRNEGIEIYMPISPEYTIRALCPALSELVSRTPQLSNEYQNVLINGSPVAQLPENVEFSNSLQVISAERFIYARSKEHLKMPIDMLKTNPELREGPRAVAH
ncbi:DUF4238 domain-containing protein [Candidatus Electrothrix sp.]|uniref:DUF4238 domain-containing protein n=1 Tax=Candidatus Electrothrix sp. TaxID=2170559 RepID=UPI0040565367